MPTLTFDTTAWPEDERTMLSASVHAAGQALVPVVNTFGVQAQHNLSGTVWTAVVNIPNAPDVSALTEAVIRARYTTEKAARDAIAAAAAAEQAGISAFASGDAMTGAKVAAVKSAVDDVFASLDAADTAAAAMSNGAPKTAMLAVLTCLRKTLVLERSHIKQHYVRGHFGQV